MEVSMKILITGSTGLVGNALVNDLQRAGHTVCRLVRPGTGARGSTRASARPSVRTSSETESSSRGFDVSWDPVTGELGGAAVGADAVVNLAGAPIADGRWTPERKILLRTSRVGTTRALVNALARMNARPRVLVSASAVGIYGNRGDELLTEPSARGTDFLSSLAADWEVEAVKAEALGIRVVLARFGIILARQGGALSQMLRPFRFGVGGKIGSGQQWMSWITLDDVVNLMRLALETGTVRGPVNFVSPQPVRNAEFTQALAKVMHRPAFFSAPEFALRLALGELADALLLSSQRCLPQKAQDMGYRFQHSEISAALQHTLKND
jgi:uncharacterized protein (TIGR01777 family)